MKRLVVLLIVPVVCFLIVGTVHAQSKSTNWWTQPITKYYGSPYPWGGAEHGDDIQTYYGQIITALWPGTVTFVGTECWESPCIADITWRLDTPVEGALYGYTQILYSWVGVGQHVGSNQPLGTSWYFIEYGLTPDWAYGVSNWRFGPDPTSAIQAGPISVYSAPVHTVTSSNTVSGGSDYTIQAGDTLWYLAYRFHTTWETLCRANMIANCNLIFPGERIST